MISKQRRRFMLIISVLAGVMIFAIALPIIGSFGFLSAY